jgi:hypothetical protein
VGDQKQGDKFGSLRGVYYLCEMETIDQCPEYHKFVGGECIPIAITFPEWVLETGIGEGIRTDAWPPITYQEFKDIVNDALKDVTILKEIRDKFCEAESLIEQGRRYQEEFNLRMARY